MFDCHIHSDFSGDSSMAAEVACDTAIIRGLSGLAFTDHLDIDFPDFDIEFNINFDVYSEFMDKLKNKYSGKLKVLKGIEAGIQAHVIEETQAIIENYDFDYVIGSVHIIDGMDPYQKIFYEGKTKDAAYKRYLEEVLSAISSFDQFDVLGHIDYIVRNGGYDDRSLRYADYRDLIDSIFKMLAIKGKGIEINTASYRDKPGINTPQYDIMLLKRFRELGGELICLGSDSHSPEHIGYKFKYFQEMLLEAGFAHTVHFEYRKPVFDKIR